jgi:tetratricopeptide (TPR) repeat protein
VSKGGTGIGEISLGDDEPGPAPPAPIGGDDEEFDQIPQEDQPRRAAPAPVSDSIETAIPPRETTGERAPARDVRRDKATTETATKAPSRVGLYAGLGLIGAIVIGGAALSLTPAGPFGTTWIDERLHGAERHAAAMHAIDAVRTAMDHDTFAGVRRALRGLDTQIQRTPSEHQLITYGVYAYYTALARFGNDSATAARARALYDRLAPLPPNTQYLSAARLARDLAQGRLDAVRRASETDPLTRDLHTMAMLDGDDAAAALEAATRANDRGHTTRTRFLLARALYLADDRAGAIREAEAVLESEHDHAGARLLLSRLLSDRAETRDRAVTLAGEVEAMGQAASTDERTEAAVMVGEIELARDHVSQARQAFERALELDPRSPQALNGVATILYRESNFTEALARFQAAHSADTSDIDAQIGIAMASIALNQPADARSTLEPLLPTHPTEPRVHFWLAKALLAANEQSAAEREFREAIRLDNANLEAYTTLASMLFAMQRPDAAEAVLEEARTHVSDQSSIHRALGEGRAARGDLSGALGEFEAAVRARPDDVRSHFLYAQTLRRLGRYDEASRQLDEVARIDEQYPGLLVERGQLAEARGDAQAALTTFRAALGHDPGNPQIIVRVIAALNANGQYAEAESQARQLLAEHGSIAEAHFVRGRALLGLGNFEQAVQEFNRAIELDATRADFRAYAAEANLGLAQYGAALEQANRAIALDPNYARGYWVRGEVRVRSGAAVQGLVDAQQALRLDPHFAPALATLADADEALGHVPEAISVYRQAIAMEPNRGEWHARLGRLLADSGHASEAVQELNRGTSLGDPVNPPPVWLAQAHRQLGDLLVDSDRAGARRHFQRFLDLTPPNAAGYADVRRAMAELGGR